MAFAGKRDITVEIGSKNIAGICSTYADGNAGELIAVIDSFGSIEISVVCGSAADELHAAVGDKIWITLAKDHGQEGRQKTTPPE